MNKSLSFITGSHYEGTFNDALHTMDGFGVYIFPDGTEYRGYLKDGKFHGYGILKMGPPNRFVFKGQFEMGELTTIETMTFADGLLLKGHYDDTKNTLDTREWRYCCDKDRQYSTEIHFGLEPVGPDSFLTRQKPARHVPRGIYDTEEGLFKESTHFLTDIPPPFYHIRFVSCIDEVQWIKENCRKGRSLRTGSPAPAPVEPNSKNCYRIIETNIKAMTELGENRNVCGCNEYAKRKQQLPNICPKVLLLDDKKPLHKASATLAIDDGDADNDSDLARTPSTESCNTLSDNTLIQDVEANVLMELRELKIPSDCGVKDTNSLMMDVRKSNVFFS